MLEVSQGVIAAEMRPRTLSVPGGRGRRAPEHAGQGCGTIVIASRCAQVPPDILVFLYSWST